MRVNQNQNVILFVVIAFVIVGLIRNFNYVEISTSKPDQDISILTDQIDAAQQELEELRTEFLRSQERIRKAREGMENIKETNSPTVTPTLPPTNENDGLYMRYEVAPLSDENLRSCGATFKRARAVFLDDICFPRSISIKPAKKRYVKDTNVRLEIFQTQSWKSFYDIEWEEARNEDAVIKTFKDVIVWRQDDVTYIKGPGVWSYSHRCLMHREPERHPPNINEVNVHLEEAILSASEIWGGGYFHLVSEKIFMLGAARHMIEQNPNLKIIFEPETNPVLEDFMVKILKVNPGRLHLQNQPFFVKNLHMPYYMTCGLQGAEHTRQTRQWIREKNANLYSEKPKDIVLIHRTESGCKRCLSNSPSILNALKTKFPDESIKMVSSGTLSLVQQMELFANTKILIAPHGAGLTNMIFLQDNSRVIEVHNHNQYVNHVYYELAISLDLIYRGIAPLNLGGNSYDFNSGDIPKILQTVEELLQEPVSVPPFPAEHLYKGKPDTMQGISDR